MSFYLDTNFVYSILFADPHTLRAFGWLRANPSELHVGDWAATEMLALVNRRARSGLIAQDVARTALVDFDTFVSSKAKGLALSPSAGVLAVDLARDPLLKLSAADALHLASAADGGHILVTFDARLADAARARAVPLEMP
jgi:uncharacterized protein